MANGINQIQIRFEMQVQLNLGNFPLIFFDHALEILKFQWTDFNKMIKKKDLFMVLTFR